MQDRFNEDHVRIENNLRNLHPKMAIEWQISLLTAKNIFFHLGHMYIQPY